MQSGRRKRAPLKATGACRRAAAVGGVSRNSSLRLDFMTSRSYETTSIRHTACDGSPRVPRPATGRRSSSPPTTDTTPQQHRYKPATAPARRAFSCDVKIPRPPHGSDTEISTRKTWKPSDRISSSGHSPSTSLHPPQNAQGLACTQSPCSRHSLAQFSCSAAAGVRHPAAAVRLCHYPRRCHPAHSPHHSLSIPFLNASTRRGARRPERTVIVFSSNARAQMDPRP